MGPTVETSATSYLVEHAASKGTYKHLQSTKSPTVNLKRDIKTMKLNAQFNKYKIRQIQLTTSLPGSESTIIRNAESTDGVISPAHGPQLKSKINQKYPKWSVEIRALDKIRKNLGKQLRVARKERDATDARMMSEQYMKATRDVNRRIAHEIADKDKRMYDYIVKCPKNQTAKRFWSYVKRTEKGHVLWHGGQDQNLQRYISRR